MFALALLPELGSTEPPLLTVNSTKAAIVRLLAPYGRLSSEAAEEVADFYLNQLLTKKSHSAGSISQDEFK